MDGRIIGNMDNIIRYSFGIWIARKEVAGNKNKYRSYHTVCGCGCGCG